MSSRAPPTPPTWEEDLVRHPIRDLPPGDGEQRDREQRDLQETSSAHGEEDGAEDADDEERQAHLQNPVPKAQTRERVGGQRVFT
jgi:hypothetical protein